MYFLYRARFTLKEKIRENIVEKIEKKDQICRVEEKTIRTETGTNFFRSFFSGATHRGLRKHEHLVRQGRKGRGVHPDGTTPVNVVVFVPPPRLPAAASSSPSTGGAFLVEMRVHQTCGMNKGRSIR